MPTMNSLLGKNVWNRFVRKQVDAAVAAERDRLNHEHRRQAALAETELVDLAVNQRDELQRTLDRIVAVATEILPATGGASIILWDADAHEFINSATSVPGQSPQTPVQRVRRSGGATQWIIDNGEPIVVPDIGQDPFTANQMLAEFANHAYVGMPMAIGREVIGVLYAMDRSRRQYSDADLSFLRTLANRAALAVTRVRLFERIQTANALLERESREKEKLIAELQAALLNIRTLQGLIPICAHCKKIRDDEGFWRQVEVYVSARSDAEFTHGICPDCRDEQLTQYLEGR